MCYRRNQRHSHNRRNRRIHHNRNQSPCSFTSLNIESLIEYEQEDKV